MPSPRKQAHRPGSVLITGGAGFIGSNFLLRMVRTHGNVTFVNLDKLTYAGNPMNLREVEGMPNYTFIQGDIAEAELVQTLFDDHGFDTVIHFAAESHVDRSILEPLAFVKTNVVGTAVLLDAARQHWSDPKRSYRFYHISTDEVFGSLGSDGFFTEETPYDPRSPYSASKAGSDHLVRAYGHTFGLPFVVSNCSNNYGPFQFPEKLIPLVIQNAIEEKPIPVYGKGENIRDWLHVEDHAAAAERILLFGRNAETYVIGGRAEMRNLDIIKTLADVVDEELGRRPGSSRNLITFVKDRAGHDFRYAMDCAKIEQDLGWTPRHTLQKGLRETVRWYLTNQDWVQAVRDESYREYYRTQYLER